MTELIEWKHAGQTFIGTPQELVDTLTYANYAYNRQLSPEVTPHAWVTVFGANTLAMEARYQRERLHD